MGALTDFPVPSSKTWFNVGYIKVISTLDILTYPFNSKVSKHLYSQHHPTALAARHQFEVCSLATFVNPKNPQSSAAPSRGPSQRLPSYPQLEGDCINWKYHV